MKIRETIKDKIIKMSGIIIMIPIIFYLNYYELKPIYEAKSN